MMERVIIETLRQYHAGKLDMVYARRDENGFVYCTFKPWSAATWEKTDAPLTLSQESKGEA